MRSGAIEYGDKEDTSTSKEGAQYDDTGGLIGPT
jgi:hypothetical protein